MNLGSTREYLRETKGANGKSVYDHMAAVMLRLVQEKPDNAIEIFEQISRQVKQESFKNPSSSNDDSVDSNKSTINNWESIDEELANRLSKLMESGKEEIEMGDEPIPTDELGQGGMPDIMAQSAAFEAAGVTIGSANWYRLALALNSLAASQPLSSIRFWGKISALKADYYVMETEWAPGDEPGSTPWDDAVPTPPPVPEEEPEQPLEDEEGRPINDVVMDKKRPTPWVPAEEFGVGVNRYTYYVCNELGQEWTRLPNVTPQQIQSARAIRKMMTGVLEAPVASHPPFPGVEAHYLRAQIARIAAATTIAPRGFFMAAGEEEEMGPGEAKELIPNEEWEPLPLVELRDAGSWVHAAPYILPQGRTVWWDPRGDAEEEEEEEEEDEGADGYQRDTPVVVPEDPPEPLMELDVDAPIGATEAPDDGAPGAWAVRKHGAAGLGRFGSVSVASVRWPGATTVAWGEGKFASVYIGDGLKNLGAAYTPPAIPALSREPEDLMEAVDPTVEEEKELEARLKEAEEDSEEGEDEGEEGEEEYDE